MRQRKPFTSARKDRGLGIGEQEHVRVDAVIGLLCEAENAQRDPWVRDRDGDVHWRAVANPLPARRRGFAIEHSREEDGAALGVEVENFGRVRR